MPLCKIGIAVRCALSRWWQKLLCAIGFPVSGPYQKYSYKSVLKQMKTLLLHYEIITASIVMILVGHFVHFTLSPFTHLYHLQPLPSHAKTTNTSRESIKVLLVSSIVLLIAGPDIKASHARNFIPNQISPPNWYPSTLSWSDERLSVDHPTIPS